MPPLSRFVRLLPLAPLLLALAVCGLVPAAHAAILLRYNFNPGATWPAMTGYATTVGGAVTATPAVTAAGTIDTYGTSTASNGLSLVVNSNAGTGAWTAGVDSGVLDLFTANSITNAGLLTLSFSLSASAANPIVVRLESYDSGGTRTGGLKKLIYPAAPNFYQRYALDLSTFAPDGAGTFNPANPKLRVYFEIGDTIGGDGWGRSTAHTLKIDNVNYSSPKYYVKNSSPGSDSLNNGLTEAAPFKTANKAIGLAAPGDIIVLMGQDVVADHFIGSVTLNKPATPDAWIVLRSYPGHKPVLRHDQWNVISMSQGSSSTPYTGTQVSSYIEIRGLTVRGYSTVDANGDRTLAAAYQPYIGLVDGRSNTNGITVDCRYSTLKSHNIRVADNVVEYNAAGGIAIIEADRASIENNITRGNAWWMIYAGSGISTLHPVDCEVNNDYRNLYQGNQVYDNETMVPWIDITAFSDGNGIILDTHNDKGYTGRNLVQNNLVYNNGGNGISALGSNRSDIVHNTVFRNSASTRIQYAQIAATYGSADVRVINNIIVAPANNTGNAAFNESVVSATSNSGNIFFQNNILYGEGSNNALPGNASFANNTTTAPLFLSPSFNPATNDFRLRSSSPGLSDAQVLAYRRGLDLDERTRLVGGANTRGAYQTRPTEAFAPIFSPQPGNFTTAQNVSLTSDTVGVTFVYTTNGTEPAVDGAGVPTKGAVYTDPLVVSAGATVKALAWKSGLAPSRVSTAVYTFDTTPPAALPAPTFYQPPRNQAGTQRVFILSRTPGSYIRFTTDGSTPTETTGTLSAKDPITVTSGTTIKAIAYKPGSGRAASPVSTNNYVVRFAVGGRSDGSATELIGANKIRFSRFTAGGDLTATRVFARVGAITGGYRAAIYSHNTTTDLPGSLLKASAAVTAPAAGWRSFALTSSQALVNGTVYWLAIWSDDAAAAIYRDTTGGTLREATATFSTTFPNSPSTSAAANAAYNYSIFATTGYAPLLSAGADQSLSSVAASASLSGTATASGVPLPTGALTTAWSVVSGPGAVTFGNAATLVTTATFSAPGTYVLRLSGADAYFPMLSPAPSDTSVTVQTVTSEIVPPGVARARFTDGSGSTGAQQYPGAAGDGWASAWVPSGAAVTPAVVSTSPLQLNTGNYLRVARAAGTSVQEGVYRQWSAATRPTTAFTRLTFDVRLDSDATVFNTIDDNLTLAARSVAGAGTGADAAFLIRTYGAANGPLAAREWGVFNGRPGIEDTFFDLNRMRPTGMILQPGVTYTFTIDLYAATAAGTTSGHTHGTYDVTISDGATTVSVTGSGFRSASYAAGPYLAFSTQQSAATDNLTFSLDSIDLTLRPDDSPPAGVVRARFTDGAGDLFPQQYPGSAGDGWLGGWLASSSAVTPAPIVTTPLKAGAATYLQVARTAGTTGQEGVYRHWSEAVRSDTGFIRLSFDVRLDSSATVFNSTGDNLTVTTRSGAGAGTGNDSAFFARVYGAATGPLQTREWGLFNGTPGQIDAFDVARLVPTGLVVQPGVTYTFTVDLYGASDEGHTGGRIHGTYDVTITDGTTTVTKTGLGFRSADFNSGPYLGFSTQQSVATDNLAFSVDNIELAPLTPAPLPAVTVWRVTYFNRDDLADPGLAATVWGDLADPDADGAVNLLEYALGTDPLNSGSTAAPALSETTVGPDTYLTLTVSKNPDATDLAFAVQSSGDLAAWSTIDTVVVSNTATELIVRDALPISAANAKRFLRLRVTR